MRFRKNKIDKESDPFVIVQVYVPKSIAHILKQKSEELKLPVSRLCVIAIDNELDAPAPFTYPCLLPTSEFIEQAYIEEAQKIIRFLYKFPNGTGRDTLILLRRDIGILNRDAFMLGYRELLENKLIEEVQVPMRSKFNYGINYLYTKLKSASKVNATRAKRKKLREAQASEIAEQEMRKKYED